MPLDSSLKTPESSAPLEFSKIRMYSLYDSLLAQHSRQLTPLRCATSTIAQLHRYFEEVVLENGLSALVIESLPTVEERSLREINRLRALTHTASKVFLFANTADSFSRLMVNRGKSTEQPIVLEQSGESVHERFVVIADARFSALLASTADPGNPQSNAGDLVVWTFEPDIVYSALEYLMARITAEYPYHASSFAETVRVSMPKATSLQLTLGVTTKLARLLQEQAEREIALNRIATAIRNSGELDSLLRTAVNEVGRALNVKFCVVQVEGEIVRDTMSEYYFRPFPPADYQEKSILLGEVERVREHLQRSKSWIIDSDHSAEENESVQAAVPLIYQGAYVGLLMVQSDDSSRIWADNELLLLHTVADQLTVAVKQAHMFALMQMQALTDSLTGCYNRRSFEMQLEKHLHQATRNDQQVSLIMMDLDEFKKINDQAGHDIGDLALRIVAETLKAELRAVDSAARFGGDEFAIILPQADTEGAMLVAERLRRKVEGTHVPGYGPITASFGLSTYPTHGSSRDTLVVAADRALYHSKNSGRNRVSPGGEATKTNQLVPA